MKIIFLIFCSFLSSVSPNQQSYNAIFSFGDSLADTGNFLLSGALAFPVIGKLPYGETFFKHATGRCSNGRLIVDFFGNVSSIFYSYVYLNVSIYKMFVITWSKEIQFNIPKIIFPFISKLLTFLI